MKCCAHQCAPTEHPIRNSVYTVTLLGSSRLGQSNQHCRDTAVPQGSVSALASVMIPPASHVSLAHVCCKKLMLGRRTAI